MRCLQVDQIYLYLEKELSPVEKKKIDKHLASCLKCQNAIEERKILVQASESLPQWKLPPDFSRQVMARIFPEKTSARNWVRATAFGFSSTIFILLSFFLLTGNNLVDFLVGLAHRQINPARNLLILFVKLIKLAIIFVKVIVQFSRLLFEAFRLLATILNPETQIILITLTFILSASLLYGLKRKFMTGEKA